VIQRDVDRHGLFGFAFGLLEQQPSMMPH
jgi:hypothetical protein